MYLYITYSYTLHWTSLRRTLVCFIHVCVPWSFPRSAILYLAVLRELQPNTSRCLGFFLPATSFPLSPPHPFHQALVCPTESIWIPTQKAPLAAQTIFSACSLYHKADTTALSTGTRAPSQATCDFIPGVRSCGLGAQEEWCSLASPHGVGPLPGTWGHYANSLSRIQTNESQTGA